MSEETKGADKSAPRAIVMSIGASAVVGWGYILALVFSIQVSGRAHAYCLLTGIAAVCKHRVIHSPAQMLLLQSSTFAAPPDCQQAVAQLVKLVICMAEPR